MIVLILPWIALLRLALMQVFIKDLEMYDLSVICQVLCPSLLNPQQGLSTSWSKKIELILEIHRFSI